MIDLGDEDYPAALVDMLKFCYLDHYSTWPCSLASEPANQHIAMYRLADLYDMPELREYASDEILNCLNSVGQDWQEPQVTDRTVLIAQKILGPDVDPFADNSIQKRVYAQVTGAIKLFYKNALFRALLADGSMFNESFLQKFTDVVGETISQPLRVCHCCHTPPPGLDWSSQPAEISW